MHRSRLPSLVLSAAIGVVILGGAPPVSASVDRASIKVETRYVLKASLNFAAGTLSSTEKIVIKNTSGGPISKVNLSVTPRAFDELTSIGNFTVDGRTVSARWTNNSNLEVQLGRDLPVGSTAT